MELSWKEQRVGGKVRVFFLARPKSADLWALGHSRRLFKASTALLHRHAGGWLQAFAVNSRLDSIGTLGDGSVMAVGESLSVLFDGDRWSTMGSGLKGSYRIWGTHPGCANALTAHGLFYFDGTSWGRLDLEAQGIRGHWADGDSDSGGKGWIVGTHGTHSCMATGSGASWREDGCGSWYLYLVYVADDGHAFAAGGDGLWRHDGTRWIDVDGERDVSRLPLALSAAGPTPIAVARKLGDLLQPKKHRAAAKFLPGSELEVFTSTGWQTVLAPIPIDGTELASAANGGQVRQVNRRRRIIHIEKRLGLKNPSHLDEALPFFVNDLRSAVGRQDDPAWVFGAGVTRLLFGTRDGFTAAAVLDGKTKVA